jgi:pectate lyase
MIMKNIGICILCLFVLFGVSNAFAVDAFPGAEGSGRFATGGRGGTVYEVTNLTNDANSGSGSIVDAVSEPNRTIVFRISGTILLGDVILRPKSNITIAGQTAPGDGICIKGRIQLGEKEDPPDPAIPADNIIIRYLRVRVDAGGANAEGDAIDIACGNNIIIDHVSASYSRDEGISSQEESDNVTVQWCIISEALNFDNHSYGSLIRGTNGQEKTYHHNLYAHNRGRNPRPGNYTGIASDTNGLHFDFRNNVVYNWKGNYGGNNDDGAGFVSRYNFIGNAYVTGPNSTSNNKGFRESSKDAYGYFLNNSYNGVVPGDSWSIVLFNIAIPADINAYKAHSYLIPMEPVTTTSAAIAKTDVLADAGASFPTRDVVDARMVTDVLNGTGSIIWDTSGTPPAGGFWPTLNSLPAPTDSDHDGMPDLWETSHGLDPNDANDRNGHNLDPDYTNLEVYLDWLVSSVRTDIVYDGIVNFSDFARFAEHWNSSVGSPLYDERYDFNRNDTISMDDLFYIAQDWLTSGQEY